ncbi:MAG: carbohydrate binding domain-containing protein [Clostridia bacterium]|nr:carbohydrate binding domain-containing protein [Clostridia bacterium]
MKKLIAVLTAFIILSVSVLMTGATGISYMADFETPDAKFGSSTVYNGTANTDNDYRDFIMPQWVEGNNSDTGLKVSYQAATWYSGEIFFPIPAAWQDGNGAEYLNFDYKGKGSIKLSLSTGKKADGTLTSGTRYTYKLTADSKDEWTRISIPLTSFVNGGSPVKISDIGCMTFQAGENGNLNNNSADTKAMTADELLAKAKTGEVVFDNMELSSESINSAVPTAEPTSAPTEEPDNTTRIIDFDDYSLSQKQTWSGFKNDSGDYSDFIKSESADGKSGKGFKLTYKAATWYAGEVFCAVPKEWAVAKQSQYLEFDAKGHGKIKIALETGEVINGTRYEAVAAVDSDEWVKISIPVAKFVKRTEVVPLSDVIGISFKAAEGGNLNNNADETKKMTATELEAKAVTGEVILDNITLSESYTAKPKAVITVGEPNEETGKCSCKVSVSNAPVNQSVTVVIALYDASGVMVSARTKTETVDSAGEIYFDTTPGEKELRIFVFDSFSGLTPLCNMYK